MSCFLARGWTTSAGSNETLPIGCATFGELYAFCIWDGGFLPSEAEWQYVAAGGSENRGYPWGTSTIDCQHASYTGAGCSSTGPSAVGAHPSGAGRWGHLDLAGNVSEVVLDQLFLAADLSGYAYAVTPSTDYVGLPLPVSGTTVMGRGGRWNMAEFYAATSSRAPSR